MLFRSVQEAAAKEKAEMGTRRINGLFNRSLPYVSNAVASLVSNLNVRAQQTQSKIRQSSTDLVSLIKSNAHCVIDQGERSPWSYDVSVDQWDDMRTRMKITCMDRDPSWPESQRHQVPEGGGLTYTITMSIVFFTGFGMDFVENDFDVVSKSAERTLPYKLGQKPLQEHARAVKSAIEKMIEAQNEEIASATK